MQPSSELQEPATGSLIGQIESGRITWSHIKVLVLSGAGVFMDGYDLFIIGVAILFIPYISGAFDTALITSAALLGAVFGAVLFGNLADRLGRKKLYVADLVFFVVFAAASALSQNLWELYLFRFLLGIGIGADYPISASYVTEFVSNRHRGKLIASVFSFQGLGLISAVIVSVLLVQAHLGPDVWRWMLLSGIVPALVALTARTKMPETPRWYLSHGRADEARKVLSGFFGYQVPEETLEAINERVSVRELLLSPYSRRVFFTSASWFLVDVGVYGIGILTPFLIADIYGPTRPLLASVVTSGELFVFAGIGYLCAIALVDVVGRKPLQTVGFFGMAIPLLAAAILHASTLLLLAIPIAVFYIFENAGPNTTTWIYPVELFPTRLRGTGHGLAATVGKIGAVVATFFLPLIYATLGRDAMLAFVGAACLAGGVLTYFMGIETKRLSLDDVSEIFKSFYDTFDRISANLLAAAELLHDRLAAMPSPDADVDVANLAAGIKELEHTGDELIHEAFVKLDKKFVAPIDRDDITKLLKTLDDTLDFIDASTSRMEVYKLGRVTPETLKFSELILGQVREIRKAVASLKGSGATAVIDGAAIRIHELENEADDLLHKCLRSLFASPEAGASPFDIIKQKEVYEYLETTTDKSEDVADVLRSLLVKYSL
ncbi:MAG: MFS transporter [Nitrososphaerota archaeon]|nr:MFS transporter [Nitrososphaerota archaeon]